MIEAGSVVAEKYWVERVLGRGGMGVVVAATHLQLGQRVALKFLKPEAARDGELVERFLREARASCRLRGEHCGRVIDVGTLADGLPYIVMEYLEGNDLATVLARSGPLPVATAVDYVLQACIGLVEAHAAGLIHRDLKPANLFLTRRPDGTEQVKVMDFGIAKAMGPIDAAITESAAVMGSPGYMSPEQLRSARDVDVRSDLWSMGVVLYELVTGRRPYEAATITELAVLLATEPVPALPSTMPRAFAAAVMRCLEKEPRRRFATVAELAAALVASGGPTAAAQAQAVARIQSGPRAPSASDGAMALMNATTLSRATSARGPGGGGAPAADGGRRRWRLPLAGAAVAVVVAGVATIIAVSGGGGGPAAPAAQAASPEVLSLPVDAGVDAPAATVEDLAGAATAPPADLEPAPSGKPSSARPRPGTKPARPATGAAATSTGAAAPTSTGGPATVPEAGTPTIKPAPPVVTSTPPTASNPAPADPPAKKPGIPDDLDGDGIPDRR
ncbi:MAG: protein kinase [Kofleriaceae bacterium]